MVYLEPVTADEHGRFSRLRADDPAELNAFVVTAGITAKFVAHRSVAAMSHYRCDRRDRRTALRHGATEVTWSDAFGRLGRLVFDKTPASPPPDRTVLEMGRGPVTVTSSSLTKFWFGSRMTPRRPVRLSAQPTCRVHLVEVTPC